MVDWIFGPFGFACILGFCLGVTTLVVDSAEPPVFPPSHPPEATTFANLRFIELQFVSQKSVKRQHLHVSADVAGSRLRHGYYRVAHPGPFGGRAGCCAFGRRY